jgi:hypothetical protein
LTDARAVAHETMRRVRANLELLVPRLRAAGYDFGYAWLAAQADFEEEHRTPMTPEWLQQMREMGVSEILLQEMEEHDGEENAWMYELAQQPHLVVQPPAPEVHDQLRELERLVGPLPLSLMAWYEEVGAVNFVGVPPDHCAGARMLIPPGSGPVYVLQREAAEPTEPDAVRPPGTPKYSYQPVLPGMDQAAAAEFIPQIAETNDATGGARVSAPTRVHHDLDPLYVYPLEEVLQSIRLQVADPGEGQYYVDLAPDEYFKYFVSGGGQYGVRVPDARIDAPLEGEWHQTTFVKYLRMCFAWAGFPGLETRIDPQNVEFARLREGLLPM